MFQKTLPRRPKQKHYEARRDLMIQRKQGRGDASNSSSWRMRFLCVVTGSCLLRNIFYDNAMVSSFAVNRFTMEAHSEFPKQQDKEPLLASKMRLIHDVTLPWNETMHRPWLALSTHNLSDSDTKPPGVPSTMLLMTNFGWNHPNQTRSLKYARSLRETEFYSAIVNHPWFHPTAWEDIQSGDMPILEGVNYYLFLDRQQCWDYHYPVYGGLTKNLDSRGNRTTEPWKGSIHGYTPPSEYFVQDSRLFKAERSSDNINATLFMFRCKGESGGKGRKQKGLRTSVAYLDGRLPIVDEDIDQGLIPAMVNPTRLTQEEEDDIRSCRAEDKTNRQFSIVYAGNFRSGDYGEFHKKHGGARDSYKAFIDTAEDVFIQRKKGPKPKIRVASNGTFEEQELSYQGLMRRTKFALAPRGDNKYSYRFSEALSAGTILIYHGDDYTFPFRPELFDWNKCALIFPEKDAGATVIDYIRKELLPFPEKVCAMRKYCYFEIYKKYIETPEGVINGLIGGLNKLAEGPRKPLPGIHCNETSIKNLDCMPN